MPKSHHSGQATVSMAEVFMVARGCLANHAMTALDGASRINSDSTLVSSRKADVMPNLAQHAALAWAAGVDRPPPGP